MGKIMGKIMGTNDSKDAMKKQICGPGWATWKH
jgi:hypothetical protein